MAMINNNFSAKLQQMQSQQLTQARSNVGTKTQAAQNTGQTSTMAKSTKSDGVDKSTLERMKQEEALEKATAQGMEQVADDAAQANRSKRKEETQDSQDIGYGEVRHHGGEKEAAPTEGSDSELEVQLSTEQKSRMKELDQGKQFRLNSDIPEQNLKAAKAKVQQDIKVQNEDDKAQNFKFNPKVDEAAEQMELKPSESLEVAGRPQIETIMDPDEDLNMQPLSLEDTHSESLAKEQVAKKQASGEMVVEEFVAQ